MLKTIKTTKQMRLDELIKYVWDNDLKNRVFRPVDRGSFKAVEVDDYGNLVEQHYFNVTKKDKYEVEIEEPITDVTLLKKAVYVHKNETLVKDFNTSINEILIGNHEGSVSKIYALINGRLELVYERDGDE